MSLASLKFKPSQFKSPFRFVYSHSGTPSSVQPVVLQNFTPAKPTPSQVRVRMLAAPINPADLNMIQGNYGALNGVPNGGAVPIYDNLFVAGSEGVGIVEEVGSAVSGLKVGQRVIAAKPGLGTWASHITSEEASFLPVDEDIPVEYAATISVNPSTAYRLLEDFNVQKGDTIVQNGANSMVGYALTQLARDRGVNVINIIRNRPDETGVQERLNQLGASVTVSDVFARTRAMRELIGELPPAKVGYNAVGGDQLRTITQFVEDNGTIVTYGGMSRQPIQIATGSLIFRDLTFKGFWMSRWASQNSVEKRQEMLNDLADKIKSKKLVLFMETWKASELDLAWDAYHKEFKTRKQVLLFDKL